jgi:hypothetical protein
VIIWDEGAAEVTRDEPRHLSVVLHGSKLGGGFALTRTTADRWILARPATAKHGPAPTSPPSSQATSALAELSAGDFEGIQAGQGRGDHKHTTAHRVEYDYAST